MLGVLQPTVTKDRFRKILGTSCSSKGSSPIFPSMKSQFQRFSILQSLLHLTIRSLQAIHNWLAWSYRVWVSEKVQISYEARNIEQTEGYYSRFFTIYATTVHDYRELGSQRGKGWLHEGNTAGYGTKRIRYYRSDESIYMWRVLPMLMPDALAPCNQSIQ